MAIGLLMSAVIRLKDSKVESVKLNQVAGNGREQSFQMDMGYSRSMIRMFALTGCRGMSTVDQLSLERSFATIATTAGA